MQNQENRENQEPGKPSKGKILEKGKTSKGYTQLWGNPVKGKILKKKKKDIRNCS